MLGDGRLLVRCNVMAEEDVVQGEEHGGPVGEVGDDHSIRDASMLVQDYQVRDVVGATCVCELFDDVVSAVDAMGVGKDQAHFLDGVSIGAEYGEGEHTFANCNNFELGSREVVMTIFGSWIPALEHLATKASYTLEELAIQSLTSFCEVLDPTVPPRLHFTVTTLAPLARATRLRRFFLDASVPADMNDADFAALARWWPCIEHLGLWTRPVDAFDYPTYFTMQPRATPASLRAFSEVCGRLRSLSVPMDISAVPRPAQAPTPAVNGNQQVLESITIGCAKKGPDVDPSELAACLYSAFPRVKRIEFDCGEETAWPDVADAYARLQAAAAL